MGAVPPSPRQRRAGCFLGAPGPEIPPVGRVVLVRSSNCVSAPTGTGTARGSEVSTNAGGVVGKADSCERSGVAPKSRNGLGGSAVGRPPSQTKRQTGPTMMVSALCAASPLPWVVEALVEIRRGDVVLVPVERAVAATRTLVHGRRDFKATCITIARLRHDEIGLVCTEFCHEAAGRRRTACRMRSAGAAISPAAPARWRATSTPAGSCSRRSGPRG